MIDQGEVLQGIGDDWTFMGANAMEWCAGLVVFLLISLFAQSPARAMPFMLAGWILTTTSLAALRASFPDQQRGARNAISIACGFKPIGIPSPSSLQPMWSPAPLKRPIPSWRFTELGLGNLLPSFQRELAEADEYDVGV